MSLDKKALRSLYRQKRRDFLQSAPEQAVLAAQNVTKNFQESFFVEKGQSAAGYSALGAELDPSFLHLALHQKGHTIFCASHACCDQGIIRFHPWASEGIEEGNALEFESLPDIKFLFVPLVAFSKSGARLGQGGGHYDRLLEKGRTKRNFKAIGLAFERQRCDTLIEEHHDQRLDAVVTEEKVYRFS